MRRRELTIPTIIGILVTIGGLAAGIFLLREPLRNLVGASAEETPDQVRITNTTDASFVVSWVTAKAISGYIQYGEGVNTSLVVSDDRDQEKGNIGNYFTHIVTIKGLKPTTKYSFKIGSGRNLYDNTGKLYENTTGVTIRNQPPADVAYGQVIGSGGDPADGAIVYLALPGVVTQAALVKSSGSWVIPLATARTTDLTSFAAYDKEKTRVEIFVQGGPLGTSSVIALTNNVQPLPEVTLGKTYDLTAQAGSTTTTPEASISSRFKNEALAPATKTSEELVLVSPKANETVNTQKPEIIGVAPAGTKITVTIHSSTVITQTVTANTNGQWSYTVPQNLSPGEHTVTITAIINGVKKTVQKTFVVEAAGNSNAPAFSSTPSAILKPTPTPIPSPTVIPRVAYPSTTSGTPQTGNLTPTLILLILGIGLVSAGVYGSYRF